MFPHRFSGDPARDSVPSGHGPASLQAVPCPVPLAGSLSSKACPGRGSRRADEVDLNCSPTTSHENQPTGCPCGSPYRHRCVHTARRPRPIDESVDSAGSLTAFPLIVQPGTRPNLTWNITYPSIVQDVVTVTQNTVTPKQSLYVDVRVLGAGVTVSQSGSTSFTFVPTEAQVSYNGGSYGRVFYGTNNNVNPNTIVYTRLVEANKPLRFGGRYYYNSKWGPYFNSQSGTLNVRTLVNGQTPPTTYPLHTAPTLESFIRPYLDAQGKVKIGPMDVIVFMELTHTDSQRNDQGYDLQDMVLLATFRTVTTP